MFALNGGCPAIRDYDGAGVSGTAVFTHKYTFGVTTGIGAIIMNKNTTLNWNTVWMGFAWIDIRDAFNANPTSGRWSPGCPVGPEDPQCGSPGRLRAE